jgi:hypothetical protein
MLGIGTGIVGTAGTAGCTSIGLNCACAVQVNNNVKAIAIIPLITTTPPSNQSIPYAISLLAVPTSRRDLENCTSWPPVRNPLRHTESFARKCPSSLYFSIESERQQPELQHLLGLAALPLGRVAQMVQALAIQDDGLRKIRTGDCGIVIDKLAGSFPQAVIRIHRAPRV